MNSSTINIKKYTEEDNHDLSIPKSLYDQLSDPTTTQFRFGQLKKRVSCTSNDTDNDIMLSEALLLQSGLEEDIETNLIVSDDSLRIGPLLGIYTQRKTVLGIEQQRTTFRGKTTTKVNFQAKTIPYYFSTSDVDLIQNKIHGVFYSNKEGRYIRKVFPLPDVLYDKGFGRSSELKTRSYRIRQTFEMKTDMKKINGQHYFDKLDVYEQLSKYERIRPYLPLTIRYRQFSDLKRFLDKYNKVYLKASISSQGKKIIRVRKIPNVGYEYSYFKRRVVIRKAKTLDRVIREIKPLFDKRRIIMQPAINLIQNGTNIVDMRATVQRNGEGVLEIVSIKVRVGNNNSPVTSTRAKSSVYIFEDFFKEHHPTVDIPSLRVRIDSFLTTIYQHIEKIYGDFGEIGMDFGLDKNDKLWFIEPNAKPAKDTIYKSYDKETLEKAFLYPLEYAKYITGFNN